MTTAQPRPAACAALVAACLSTSLAAEPLKLDADFPGARELQDPVRWLLAQAPGAPAAAAPPSPVEQPSPAPTWAATIFPFLGSGEPVGFAQPRWGGSIALEYLDQRGEEGRRRYIGTTSATLNAASYFWQPWFAQVRGTLILLGGIEKANARGADETTPTDLNRHSLSGSGALTVFPASRFPFLASLESFDSRASGEFTPSDQRNTRATLRQTWRDPLGTTTYVGSLDYSGLRSESFGRDTVLQLDGRFLRNVEPHRIDGMLAWSRNRRDEGEGGTDILRAFGTHHYSPTPDLWVSSLANFSDFGTELGGGGRTFTQRLGQATTQAVWRPETDDRLVFTGGGRLFVNQFVQPGAGSTALSLSGNAGASFAVTEEATLNASASLTKVSAGADGDSLVRLGSVGATYVSRPIDLRFASYSLSGSVQGGHQAGGVEESRSVAAVQADQQLSRAVAVGDAVSLNLMATQGGGVTHDTVLGRTDTLRGGVSAAVRVQTSESSDAYFGASYSAAVSKGGLDDRFRLANAQASGELRFGPYDSLSANLTAQWVRSEREPLPDEEVTRQIYGGLTYRHSRVFGVPRLRYHLNATFNEGVLVASRVLGDVDAPRENVTQFVEQRLTYDIGRLEVRLGMRIAKIEGRDDLQWYLRIQRQIGQY